jgi:hypothetical protein
MEIDNLRVTKLRAYLFDIIQNLNEQYEQINVNFLSNDINNYSLDKIPVQTEGTGWIIGNIMHRDVYNFRSRMNYSADVISNIENIGFYEAFEKTIKQNNENKILPDIDGIESIECLNCGTMNNSTTNTAEFDIQIQITYREDLSDYDMPIVSL